MSPDFVMAAAVSYEAPNFVYQERPFIPRIAASEQAGLEYNGVMLKVKAGLFCQQAAAAALACGQLILWDLSLSLAMPLAETQTIVESFWRSLDARWQQATVGINLFSGAVAELTSQVWEWLPEGHFEAWCTMSELSPAPALLPYYGVALLESFASQLGAGLPEQPLYFACLDASVCQDQLAFYQLAQRARSEQLHLFWQPPQPHDRVELAWRTGTAISGCVAARALSMLGECRVALCLPPASCFTASCWEELRMPLQQLAEQAIVYRPVAQELMALTWTGFDVIIVVTAALSPLARRQLAGFAAAGGQVVTVGAAAGITYEESFSRWLAHNR